MDSVTTPLSAGEALEVRCGAALDEHYPPGHHQTFHHAPSVAAVVLDTVPDGYSKRAGRWVAPLPVAPSAEYGPFPDHPLRDVPEEILAAARAVLDDGVDTGDVGEASAHPLADAVVIALLPYLARDVPTPPANPSAVEWFAMFDEQSATWAISTVNGPDPTFDAVVISYLDEPTARHIATLHNAALTR